MRTLEVFFDYICPYCLKAHQSLKALLAEQPDIAVIWRPCESHPRPERFGPHSDLLIRSMYLAKELGVDLMAYHDLAYRAVFDKRIDIESPAALADFLSPLIDAPTLLQALKAGRFTAELEQGNELAFLKSGVWAVPALRMEGKKLDAVENIGIHKDELAAFLSKK